jgi:hypothetical protein
MDNNYEGWGAPFSKPDPTVREFKNIIEKYSEDIIFEKDANKPDYIQSHKIESSIRVRVINDDSDDEYELVGVDIDRLGGCGCWSGIVLEVKKVSP